MATERSKLLADAEPPASPTRSLGLVAIVVVIWAWVVQAEAAQALQDASHFSKPFFIVCFNHTVTIVMLPAVYVYHRVQDSKRRSHSMLHEEPRSNGFVAVLQRHSEVPLSKLLRMATFLSVFYCFADYFWYAALANVSVAAGTAIFNCSPFFVYCFSICFLRERVSLRKLSGVLLSFVGVTLIVIYQNGDAAAVFTGAESSSLGFIASLLVVVSAAIYGAYEVAVRVVVSEDIDDTSTLLTLTGLCGLLSIPIWIVGSIAFAYSPFPSLYEPLGWPVSGDAVAMLFLSGSLAAVFNVAFPFALCWTSPLETSVGCMLTIPLSGLWDSVFHHTVFSWQCVVGSACVMAGFGVLEFSSSWVHTSKTKSSRYSMAETAAVWSPASNGDVVV